MLSQAQSIVPLSSVPGSVNDPVNVVGTNVSGPLSPMRLPPLPLKAVIVGATFATATVKVAWPEPLSLSVTLTVTV